MTATPLSLRSPSATSPYRCLTPGKSRPFEGLKNLAPLPLGEAEEAARSMRIFLATDLSKSSLEQKKVLIHQVTRIDNALQKYNESINSSGLIAFFTVVLLVLTLGIYNLRKSLIHEMVTPLLPQDWKDIVNVAKQEAEIVAVRKKALELLLALELSDHGSVDLMKKLQALEGKPPMQNTEQELVNQAAAKAVEQYTPILEDLRKEQVEILAVGAVTTQILEALFEEDSIMRPTEEERELLEMLPQLGELPIAVERVVYEKCLQVIAKYTAEPVPIPEGSEEKIIAIRNEAFELLSSRYCKDDQAQVLTPEETKLFTEALCFLKDRKPIEKIEALREAVIQYRLGTIVSAAQIFGEYRGTVVSPYGIGYIVDNVMRGSFMPDVPYEVILADGSKLLFAKQSADRNVLPLQWLQFAFEEMIDAECLKVITKYTAALIPERAEKEIVQMRRQACTLLEARDCSDEEEKLCAEALYFLHGRKPIERTQSLKEAFVQHRLNMTKSAVMVFGGQRGSETSLYGIGSIIDPAIQGSLKPDIVYEVTLANGAKHLFAKESTSPNVLPLELLQFTFEELVNAECLKVIEKYKQ